MPRALLNIESQGEGKRFSIGEANGEIVNAVVIAHQNPPATRGDNAGGQEEPTCKLILTIAPLGMDHKPTGDEEVEEQIKIGSLDKFHPGRATGPDDEDPEDLGDELGTEGNCVYTEGAVVQGNSKMGKFAASLEQAGFPADLLTGYAPNLIGLVCHFKIDKIKGDGRIKDWDALVVDAIHKLPGTSKKAAGGGKMAAGKGTGTGMGTAKAATAAAAASAAAPAKVAAKAPASTKAAPKAADNGAGDEAVVAAAESVMDLLGERHAGSVMTRSQTAGTPASRIPRMVPMLLVKLKLAPETFKPVQALFAEDWFVGAAEARGWLVDGEEVTIPPAE